MKFIYVLWALAFCMVSIQEQVSGVRTVGSFAHFQFSYEKEGLE